MGKILHVVLLAIVLSCTSAEDANDKGPTVSETVNTASSGKEKAEKKEDTGKRSSDSNFCFVRGRVYKNGDVFVTDLSHCVKYRCENGVHRIVEEGCYVQQTRACVGINTLTEVNCFMYRCTKTLDSNFIYYNFEPVDAPSCKDYYGRCRQFGEILPYAINGRLYNNCVCRKVSPVTVRYECHSR